MGSDEGSAPPPEGELRRERCPSCGGLLTFTAERPEGYCAIEDIFVEAVLPPPAEPSGPVLVRARVLAASKKELHDLCATYGLRVSGNKTDLLTRLLRYMDDHGIDLPPEEREPEAAAVSPEEIQIPSAPTPIAAESAPPPEELGFEPVKTDTEIPVVVPPFDLEVPLDRADRAPPSREEVAVELPVVNPGRLRRDRWTFYVGSSLTAAGGVGLLLGSFLHDAFRVPLFGDSYEAFGPLNVTAAILGGILLLAGLGAIGLSLRGGVVRAELSGV